MGESQEIVQINNWKKKVQILEMKQERACLYNLIVTVFI